jgi:hypothetical protein
MLPIHAPADRCIAFAKIGFTSLNRVPRKQDCGACTTGATFQNAYCKLVPRHNVLVIGAPSGFAKEPLGGWQRPVAAQSLCRPSRAPHTSHAVSASIR